MNLVLRGVLNPLRRLGALLPPSFIDYALRNGAQREHARVVWADRGEEATLLARGCDERRT